MECPRCRREIAGVGSPSDLVFCPYCGENIAFQAPEPMNYCPACGQRLPPDAAFCPRCGKRLIAVLQTAEPPPPQPQPSIPTSPAPPPAPLPTPEPPSATPARHRTSREDITDLVREDVPEPRAKPRAGMEFMSMAGSAGHSARQVAGALLMKASEPLRDMLSGRWRLRRLYRNWAKAGVFSPDEIPDTEGLDRILKEAGGRPHDPWRIILIVAATLLLIVFLVLIGITISQCG